MKSTPPPRSGEKNPTFRRAVFSAKEVPSAQHLSPRAQTHLPFGCSVVGVMWKPKAALNLQKKISSLGLYMVPDQWYVRTRHWSSGICTGLQIDNVGSNPNDYRMKILHFLSLGSDLHPKLSFFFMQKQG